MRFIVLPIIAALCWGCGTVSPPAPPAGNAAQAELLAGLAPADRIAPRLDTIKSSIVALDAPNATGQSRAVSLKAAMTEVDLLDKDLASLRAGLEAAESVVGSAGSAKSVEESRVALGNLRGAFALKLKDLESDDQLEDFEIQELMAPFNEAERLASNIIKKAEDTRNALYQKT